MAKQTITVQDFQPIVQILETLIEDTSIPKNVRASITKAKEKLNESDKDANTVLTNSIHALEEVVNDVNMPMHGRTMLWNILSELEVMKEKTL
ncbi:MAG: UPF0147 family protein [Candidatus Micrarchaeota archaeon]